MLLLWPKQTLLQGHLEFTDATNTHTHTHTLILHNTVFSYIILGASSFPHLFHASVSKSWYKLVSSILTTVLLQEPEQSAVIITYSQGV